MKTADDVKRLASASANSADMHIRMYLDTMQPADGVELGALLQMMILRAAMLIQHNGGTDAACDALYNINKKLRRGQR